MGPSEGAPGGPNAKAWLQAYRTKEWGCGSTQPVALSHTATIGQMVRVLSHRNLEGTGEFSSPGTVSVGQALAHLFSFLTLKYDSYQRRHSCFLNSRPAVPPSAVTCTPTSFPCLAGIRRPVHTRQGHACHCIPFKVQCGVFLEGQPKEGTSDSSLVKQAKHVLLGFE